MSLERALARLLYDADFRTRLAAGGATGLDEDAREAFCDLDSGRVEAVASAIVNDVRVRRHRGLGSLEELFGDALSGLDEAQRRALFSAFVGSPHFVVRGACLEEAFARFLLEENPSFPADVVERSLFRAVTRSLAIHGEPAFALPSGVHRRARGWCAVARGPLLFAAVSGRALEGPIDDLTAAMLTCASRQDALDAALARGATVSSARRVLEAIEDLGLGPRAPGPGQAGGERARTPCGT